MARYFGDRTAELLGRLSLNPLRHIDPIGTVLVPGLMLALGGPVFGWAKPVPTATSALRNPRRAMILVALAGPAANLFMALAWCAVLGAIMRVKSNVTLDYWIAAMAQAGIWVNVVLAVFNLLPIPPLDGGRVLAGLLPPAPGGAPGENRTGRPGAGAGIGRVRHVRMAVRSGLSRHGTRHRCADGFAGMSGPIQNRRVLSGMRPTGLLHLGNYHGALKNWIELQYQYECFFFIADWHALTTGYEDTSKLEEHVWTMAIDWLAAGLNPGVATLVHSIAGAGARGTASVAVDDHAVGLAGARPVLQGSADSTGRSRLEHLRLSRLSLAAIRGHFAVPLAIRAGGRGSGCARGNHARGGTALQPHLRPRSGIRTKGRESHQELGLAQLDHVPHVCARSSRKRATPTLWPRRVRWSNRMPV